MRTNQVPPLRRFLSRAPRAALLITILATTARSVRAHDFWIAPSSFTPKIDERVSLELFAGQQFAGEVVTRNPDKIARFFVLGPSGKPEPIVGIEGKSPAGFLRCSDKGLSWIGYRSRPTPIELAAEKFEAYLADEGLERVIEMRSQRSENAKPGKEIYSRCAKSLVWVGGGEAKDWDRKLGFPLEILPEQNPYALKPGDELTVLLTYLDKPLEGALVGCMTKADPPSEVRLRTDAEGHVKFKLQKSGPTLVRVVHMTSAPAGSGADWESLWASMTFEIPASPGVEPVK